MFNEIVNAVSIDLHSATFANCTNAFAMFSISGSQASNAKCQTIDLRSAVFGIVPNITRFVGNQRKLTTLRLDSATFASVSTTTEWLYYCNLLSQLDVPQNSTAILPTSTAANAPMDLHFSPLTYTSMLKVANWLSDLTGQSAHTCTFKATAWNALTAAEQATIQGILSGKNWTLATA